MLLFTVALSVFYLICSYSARGEKWIVLAKHS